MINLFRRAFLFGAGALAMTPLLKTAVQGAASLEIDYGAVLTYPYAVPALPYACDANAPAIDAQSMQLHHDKHHAA